MASSDGSRTVDFGYEYKDLDSFVSLIRRAVEIYYEGYGDDFDEYHEIQNQSFVTATTVALQDRAEKFLKEFGFKRVHSSFNEKYCNVTAVSLWVMDAKEFMAQLEKKEK